MVPSATATSLPRQCGRVAADEPAQVRCPRGWAVCKTKATDGTESLFGVGFISAMPSRVWHDANRDGVPDNEARYTYDRFGHVLTVWLDRNGDGVVEFEARNSFDARGLLIETWSDEYYDGYPEFRQRYRYNPAGWLIHQEEQRGDHIEKRDYKYDAAGELLPSGADNLQFTLNAAGNVVREWRKGWQKQYVYDAQQRVVHAWVDGNPGPVQYDEQNVYDAAGNVIKKTTVAGPGSSPEIWNVEYDAAGRITRSWSDTNADGKPESETRTTFDAAGRLLVQVEDRDGDGKPNVVHGTDYNAAGQPTRVWLDGDGDGKNDTETLNTYDGDGLLIRQRRVENGRETSDIRKEYAKGKLVHWWLAADPTAGERMQYDAAGNLVVADKRNGLLHFEYDAAAKAELTKAAPAQCSASAPARGPAEIAMALDPQARIAYVDEYSPGKVGAPPPPKSKPIVAPKPPKRDAAGFAVGDEGSAFAAAFEAYLTALREQTYAAQGWKPVGLHEVDVATKAANMRGLLVEKRVRRCGPRSVYMIDRNHQVFVPSLAITCRRTVAIKIHGSAPGATYGCGREPPPKDVYAEVPADAKLLPAAPVVPLVVPVCFDIQADRGPPPPPP